MSYAAEVWELRYEEHSSFKFYRVYVLGDHEAGDYRTLFQWGRVGTKGQAKVEAFSSHGAAMTFAIDKRDEKRKKGYQLRHHRVMETVSPELLQAAAVNERSQLQAQEAVDRSIVAQMMAKLDSAVRLATGTTDDQAQAVIVAQDLRIGLVGLQAQVLQLEAGVESLDFLIMNQLA